MGANESARQAGFNFTTLTRQLSTPTAKYSDLSFFNLETVHSNPFPIELIWKVHFNQPANIRLLIRFGNRLKSCLKHYCIYCGFFSRWGEIFD